MDSKGYKEIALRTLETESDQLRFATVQPAESGSDRKFIRLSYGKLSWILMISPDLGQAEHYIILSLTLSSLGVRVPKLLSVLNLPTSSLILIEDCGQRSLKTVVREILQDKPSYLIELYSSALKQLKIIKSAPLERELPPLNVKLKEILPEFDMRVLNWEIDYFCENVLQRYFGYNPATVLLELRHLSYNVLNMVRSYPSLIHRDFQSDNILVNSERELVIIDFQSAHIGTTLYDLASLLEDPYVNLPSQLKMKLLDIGFSILEIPSQLRSSYHIVALHRLLQASGAYVNLSIGKGKLGYLKYLRPALKRALQFSKKLNLSSTARIIQRCLSRL